MRNLANWLSIRTSTFFEIVVAPESAFNRDLGGHSYLLPLSILGLSFVLISWLQAPLAIQWARLQMQAASASPDQISASLAVMWRVQRWSLAAVPLLLFVKWLLCAAMLWLVAQLCLASLTFARGLGIVAYSYLPVFLRDATMLFILWMRGAGALDHPEALNVAIGLNLLFPQLPLPWSALAGNFNLFELWYLMLMILGISAAAAVRRRVALAIVLPGWLVTLFIQFCLVSLGLSMRSGLGRG